VLIRESSLRRPTIVTRLTSEHYLLSSMRYNPRRSIYPLRISYSTPLRRFREHRLDLQRVIANSCPKFVPYRAPRLKMPCILDTLCRDLRKRIRMRGYKDSPYPTHPFGISEHCLMGKLCPYYWVFNSC
jgi:hypothetical protein